MTCAPALVCFRVVPAGVAVSLDGRLLIVGAPTAWDNNMDSQSGAVYLIDIEEVRAVGFKLVLATTV
jgi:hypothetical protein